MTNQITKLPQFNATLGDGSIVSEDYFFNQKVVLFFYPKDDTPGCTIEAQDFSKLNNKFIDLDIKVYGISKDNQKSHKKFISKYELLVDLLFDHDGSICNAFDVWKEKKMYGKQYYGIERSTFLINNEGQIIQSWRKVKVDGHVMDVLNQAHKL